MITFLIFLFCQKWLKKYDTNKNNYLMLVSSQCSFWRYFFNLRSWLFLVHQSQHIMDWCVLFLLFWNEENFGAWLKNKLNGVLLNTRLRKNHSFQNWYNHNFLLIIVQEFFYSRYHFCFVFQVRKWRIL